LFAVTAAVYTKSIAGLFLLPPLFIFAGYKRKWGMLFKEPRWYVGFALAMGICLMFYWLREIHNPGYLQAVWENDLGGRFLKTKETNYYGPMYYFESIYKMHMMPWYWLIPCGMVVGYYSVQDKIKDMTVFATLLFLWLLGMLSFGKTTLDWYLLPAYPFVSFLVAIVIYFCYLWVKENIVWNQQVKIHITHLLFLFLLFAPAYKSTINRTFFAQDVYWTPESHGISTFLRKVYLNKASIDQVHYCFLNNNGLNDLYVSLLKDKGYDIKRMNWDHAKKGDRILVCEQKVVNLMETNYKCRKEFVDNGVYLFTID
jgi:hypothetical protein